MYKSIVLISNLFLQIDGPPPPPNTGGDDGPEPPPGMTINDYIPLLILICIFYALYIIRKRNK